MCNNCNNHNDWKFCPYCGEELKKSVIKEKVTQEEFDKIFLDLLKSYSKIAWIDDTGNTTDIPTSRFVLKNSDDEWLFEFDLSPKNQFFWYSAHRVFDIFRSRYGLADKDVKELMKNQLSKRFKMISPHLIQI